MYYKGLVTGVNGQLGLDIAKELNRRKIQCLWIGKTELDITDEKVVNKYISKLKPECVIHCAAYTSVDEKERCTNVNVYGTEHIAKACKNIDTRMIYISTDYVFYGR